MIKIKHKLTGKILFEVTTLYSADLRSANLRSANLDFADLRYADLRGANLRSANLRDANLQHADLDFSTFPLWCGSFEMKVDTRFVWQLIAHIGRLDTSRVSPKAKKAIKTLKPYFNEFCKYRDDVKKI
jgi:hypothetical protein